MQHVTCTVSRNSQRDKGAEMFSAGSVQDENTMYLHVIKVKERITRQSCRIKDGMYDI